MTLSQAKTIGGIGAILMLLLLVPTAGFALWIVGAILVLVAVKYISDAVADRSIFNNFLVAVVVGIVGSVVGGVFLFSSVIRLVSLRGTNGFLGNYNITSALGNSTASLPTGTLLGLVTDILVGLVLFWVFFVIHAFFLRRSYSAVAVRTGVGMFRTASLLYLIGAALTVILVGLVVVFVAEILLVVAFFSLPDAIVDAQPQVVQYTPTQGPTS